MSTEGGTGAPTEVSITKTLNSDSSFAMIIWFVGLFFFSVPL